MTTAINARSIRTPAEKSGGSKGCGGDMEGRRHISLFSIRSCTLSVFGNFVPGFRRRVESKEQVVTLDVCL
jgi:hypothetical protein